MDWFSKPELLTFFLHIIHTASEKDIERKGITIHRGQSITSLGILSESLGLGKQVIRTCLSKLKDRNLIKTNVCKQYTIITICNYEDYMLNIPEAPPQLIKEEKPKETENSDKKPKKTKEELKADTEKRKAKFYKELVPYVETYGKKMVRDFFDYWSETNKSGSRMRYEQETTWNLNLRIQRWGRQQSDYKGKPSTALHNSEDKDYNEGGW